ncbi:MAG: ADP-ribosylglycohydrolase family protein [Candidatus Uhrbacteria bacterium]
MWRYHDSILKLDPTEVRDRFRGCMLGLAIGDALGMPVETMTEEQILDGTGGRGVEGFLAPLHERFHSTCRLRPGQWTDDTQLARAIARSLVRRGTFDLDDIANAHVEAYHGDRRGWGGSTTRGIAELAEGKRKPDEPVIDTSASGLGNGVAMKIAPVALFFLGRAHDLLRLGVAVDSISDLTHRDAVAYWGALAIAYAIRDCAIQERVSTTETTIRTVADSIGWVSEQGHTKLLLERLNVVAHGTSEQIAV